MLWNDKRCLSPPGALRQLLQKNTKQRVIVTGALLTALFLFGVLLTGTLQAQSAQPYMPKPGWNYGMMGQGMMVYGDDGLWLRHAGWHAVSQSGDLWKLRLRYDG